ncbi:Phosphoribulokinase / Uridine kinase family protein [Actinomyces ruminicola]|uniref:Phosphoribulokinase / Uridine kinase family protein n=1 Tax=Actinomyces ruminicola TaxID=332524 RepID=A0A1H0EAN1_9ACTO|nr:phosphoribulokinase [Actinomyces ruminicola]SDN79343.1 Phosphoribulokinase / Uridine kinase family protein [Actinomyces ruminicola]
MPTSPIVRTGTAEVLLAELGDRLAERLHTAAAAVGRDAASATELHTRIDDGPDARSGGRLVVGLTGAPGAGKSTLAAALEHNLRQRELLAGGVPMDGFHMSNAVLDALGRHGRKGAPDTFDVVGYLSVLDRVRAPGCMDVLTPVYRRDLHEPVAAGALVSGPGVVVTEGNYLALESGEWRQVRARIDLLIFLEVPEAELIDRLVSRHQDFGRSIADAGHWVRTVDVPNARLVSACAHRCDEIWRLRPAG